MEHALKNSIDQKKSEILEKFKELSELYQQDSACANTFDYRAINTLLECAKTPDTDVQSELFGLFSGALEVAIERFHSLLNKRNLEI